MRRGLGFRFRTECKHDKPADESACAACEEALGGQVDSDEGRDAGNRTIRYFQT